MYYALIAFNKDADAFEYLWGDEDHDAVAEELEAEYADEDTYIMQSIVQVTSSDLTPIHMMVDALNGDGEFNGELLNECN